MKLWEMFKKVVAVIIALYIFMFTCLGKVYASGGIIFAESLKYLVPLLQTVLVGSGAYTSDQVENMTDKMLIEASGDLGNMSAEAFIQLVADLGISVYLDDTVNGMVGSSLGGLVLKDWILSHQDDVKTKFVGSDFDMKGYGAICIVQNSVDTCFYYGDYGVVTQFDGYNSYTMYGNGTYEFYNTSNDVMYYSDSYIGSVGCGFDVNNAVKLYGDWRVLGEEGEEDIYEDAINPDGETIPESIGYVIINGITYPVNADGTVTIDGIDYPINSDGTVTVNNETYAPTYNITNVYTDDAAIDLLYDILQQLEKMTIVETEDTTALPGLEDAVLPDALAASDLAGLQMPSGITSVFPFCIPFDVYYGIRLLAADPVAPRFEIPFEIPEIGVFPGYKSSVVIDFAEYDKYFKVVRWGTYFIAVMGICFLSFKIVKGNT